MFSAKHYLCGVTLVLCVGGSAYANKNPAARGLMQKFKAGIASKLPSDGKLAHKLANSKLGRTAVAGFLGITLVCGGISGCGNGDGLITPTETEVVSEVVQVVERYDGDSIYFELGGTIYEGRVIEGVSADEVLVSVAGTSDFLINIDDIGGTLIADHPDLGVKVMMLGEREGEKIFHGKITGVYGDNTRKIELFSVEFVGGGGERLDVPRIRFVAKDTDFEDGGYLTREEFGRLFD